MIMGIHLSLIGLLAVGIAVWFLFLRKRLT
jgi:hypothetical protein